MPHKMRHLRDAGSLRALAHPLRQEIYEQLILRGPLTATELSDLLDESPANCSWHLRKLAEHDFVEEAEGGKGRQRPWQATSQGLTWSEADDDEETRRSAAVMTQMMIDREVARLRHSLERLRSDEPEWDQASTTTQSMFWLTPEELKQVSDSLRELALTALDRHEDPSLRPPGSRLCTFAGWALPTYDLMDPTPEETPGGPEDGDD